MAIADERQATIDQMVQRGKGILAADESQPYAVTERRCIQGGLTPAYSDHRGRMIRSGVTNGCAG